MVCLLFSATASANGRFPSAQYVIVGPGARGDALAVRTTFGLFVSRDGGSSFAWVCEESLGVGGTWDAPLALGADGSLSLGLPDGAARGLDDCAFARSLVGPSVIDLAASPDGERVYGAARGADGNALVLRSRDRGRSYEPLPLAVPDVVLTTLDVAPSRPGRLWAVGHRGVPARAVLLRSEDDGGRFDIAAASIAGAETAFLSAVDARDADRLWVRVPRGASTELVRSDDGGRTWRSLLTVAGPMEGFALAADGRVWAGGPAAGLLHARDGERFVPVDGAPIRCLRHHAGALYACTDHTRDGVALVRVRDGAEAREPLLRYRDAEGVPDCPGSTAVFATCAPLWRSVRDSLLRQVLDAGVDAPPRTDASEAEGPRDVPSDRSPVPDAPSLGMDADVASPAPRVPTGCGCDVARGPARGLASTAVGIALLACRARRRRHAGEARMSRSVGGDGSG